MEAHLELWRIFKLDVLYVTFVFDYINSSPLIWERHPDFKRQLA